MDTMLALACKMETFGLNVTENLVTSVIYSINCSCVDRPVSNGTETCIKMLTHLFLPPPFAPFSIIRDLPPGENARSGMLADCGVSLGTLSAESLERLTVKLIKEQSYLTGQRVL